MKRFWILLFCLFAGCSGGKDPSVPASQVDALPLNTRSTVPESINEGAVIPFEHALPSQNLDGRHNGTYNNVELAIPDGLDGRADIELLF